MDVVTRSNNNPVNAMPVLMSGIINDLDKVMNSMNNQSVWSVVVVECDCTETYILLILLKYCSIIF